MTVADSAVDRPLVDVVIEAIDADDDLTDEVKLCVMAALEGPTSLQELLDGISTPHVPEPSGSQLVEEPVGAFLTSITVAGFRGIGPKAALEMHPAPGITIVSGRNGSGKSSFAEALEFAITGSSYRWENKAKLWADTWRNLHQGDPCEVRVGLTIEGSEPTVVGVDWTSDAALKGCSTWTQVGKQKRSNGTDALGWKSAVELHRPILSYDEIGGLFDATPSTLHDALTKLLGLDEITDAEKRLAAVLKEVKGPRQRAAESLRQLKTSLSDASDDRAKTAAALVKKRVADLDAVLALATGADASASPALIGLKRLAALSAPTQQRVDEVVAELRAAVADTEDAADEALSAVEQGNDLLDAALRLHSETGTIECPVCATGTLDDAWAEHSRAQLAEQGQKLAAYKHSRRRLDQAQRAAVELGNGITDATAAEGVDLPSLSEYRKSVAVAREQPSSSSGVADHLATTMPAVIESAESLRNEAKDAAAQREDTWAPIAGRLAAWATLESAAREADEAVKNVDAAKKWIASHAKQLRDQRLAPIAEQARDIWAELRQESNVDFGAINLVGHNTSRRVVMTGSVDGVESEALSVMSQGELHALGLALFIPRATTSNSPFRFIVLDDPIQAMDPAKIDGFIKVLSTLAKTRQVIVFSHDDRLATAIRQLAVDARLVEVMREPGSNISVSETQNQATRYFNDVRALVLDENVPEDVKRRVAPGLFRLALESAAQQVFYAKQHRAGESRLQTEERWSAVHKTRNKIALAVHQDADQDVSQWLGFRTERSPTLYIANAGSHKGADRPITWEVVGDLKKMVDGILAE
ncbi:AAA family ATPase [Rhodococcoides fascians]|uniref:AAA family ATPase n=1 Tax=Rhodococcoides fascians TaxID=1828 RepID=UPI001E0E181B|nr:AAA family ATPase [Rhodococcus fascians]CAH0229658.1 DNA replication and repair protein RecF [Rhodococcus fascians]